VHDRQLGVTSLVSRDNSSNQASAGVAALSPSISDDGRFVAFVSSSANLVSSVSVFPQIYLRDVQLGVVSLVSKDNSPVPVEGNGLSSEPSVNANGRFVTFSSLSINLGAVSGNQQIYVRALP
jgi:Tol biopolymer transport system component